MHRRDYLRPDQLAKILQMSKRQCYRVFPRVEVKGKNLMVVPEELKAMEPGDRCLKPSTVAKLLNVHKTTIYRWFWEGKLSGFKLPGYKTTLRIFESSVKKLIESDW